MGSYNNVSYNNIVCVKGTPSYYNAIRGSVYQDENHDCIPQVSEKIHKGIMIKALPGPYYGRTNEEGNYQILADSGTVSYTVTQLLNPIESKLLSNQCTPAHTVQLTGHTKDTCCFNFADSIKQCAALTISIQNTRMRRCAKNNTYINYCNPGNISSANTKIKVEYPSNIVPLESTPMWTSREDSVLIYELGTIGADFCGTIKLTDSVVCNNPGIRGTTACIKATISPAFSCTTPNPSWDGSSITVKPFCNDSIRFTIKNSGSGNMSGNRACRVYVNDTLIFTDNFMLQSGEEFMVSYPADKNTVRVEADQHPLYPTKSRPRGIIEACGAAGENFIGGLVTTAPQDDLEEEVAITCNTIVDSFDPNDKRAIPSGTGINHQVVPGEEIEYIIRFQNTGTDTAYVVKITDTLDVALDPGSFTEGASSHPYTLEVSGKGRAVLQYTFSNINLPDSTTNNPGSNGLVSFRIKIPDTTPLGTVIRNKANIYFDYNDPVITNETMHTTGITVEQDLSKGTKVTLSTENSTPTDLSGRTILSSARIYPNPTTGLITVETPEFSEQMEIHILSVLGILQKNIALQSARIQEVTLGEMKQGTYLYEIWQKGARKTGGMLQVR